MTTTLIKNVQLLQNDHFSAPTNLLFEDTIIKSLNAPLSGAYDQVVDGTDKFLIPGLIDSHTHTSNAGLADALKFGVTTELEMMGMARQRRGNTDEPIADVFSAGMGVTAKGGHPAELKKGAGIPASVRQEMAKMSPAERDEMMKKHAKTNQKAIQTPADARKFVDAQVDGGADFVKIMLDDGKFEGSPALPVLPREVLAAAVDQGHQRGKLVIAHALAADYALEAVELGVDGLAHMFLNRDQQTATVIDAIVSHHVFVTPCLCLNASITGILPTEIANDPRVSSRLNDAWNQNLHRTFNTAPQLSFEDSIANVHDLLTRGVRILAGTDVSQPAPNLGGLAHGASLHHELRLLCQAGMTTVQALQAATAVPASIFAPDRGQIAVNKRADLVLLTDNPLVNIDATLDIKQVWTAGRPLTGRK